MQGASFKYKKPEDSPQAEFYGGKQRIAVFTCLFLTLTVQIYKAVKPAPFCITHRQEKNSLGSGKLRHTEMFKKLFSNALTLFYHLGTTMSY